MLRLQTIKADPEFVISRLAVKGFDGRAVITEILDVDAERRRLQKTCDDNAQQLKKLAASIGMHMKKGEKEAAEEAKAVTEAADAGAADAGDSVPVKAGRRLHYLRYYRRQGRPGGGDREEMRPDRIGGYPSGRVGQRNSS